MSERLNLIETIAKEDKFSTFSRLLGTSGATSVFSGEGPFTVFVPTNDAFGKIPDKKMNELLKETDQLKALISYHVLPGKLLAANLGSMPVRKSVTGQEVAFMDSNGLKVNGATVQARNIEATNGVIHQLDTVLTQPPNAELIAAKAKVNQLSTGPLTTPTPEVAQPELVPPVIPAKAAANEKSIL